jgi:hypothetical protein
MRHSFPSSEAQVAVVEILTRVAEEAEGMTELTIMAAVILGTRRQDPEVHPSVTATPRPGEAIPEVGQTEALIPTTEKEVGQAEAPMRTTGTETKETLEDKVLIAALGSHSGSHSRSRSVELGTVTSQTKRSYHTFCVEVESRTKLFLLKRAFMTT